MPNKSIVAETRLVPNYLFHLLAVARAGYDSEYAERYAESVPASDIRFISDHRELLQFGQGQGSALCQFALFLPITLDLDCRGAVDEFLRLVTDSLKAGSTERLFHRYRHQCERLRASWFAPTPDDILACAPHLPQIDRYADIIYRNWNIYQLGVWPTESRAIVEVAAQINDFFAQHDTIARWERLTGKEFKAERYHILLCSALQNGPNANSMGYDKVVFWSGRDLEWTIDFISHEVGTHLLVDALRESSEGNGGDWNEIYAAYESLCRYLNSFVLEREPRYKLDQFHESEYRVTYRELIPDPHVADYKAVLRAAVRSRANS